MELVERVWTRYVTPRQSIRLGQVSWEFLVVDKMANWLNDLAPSMSHCALKLWLTQKTAGRNKNPFFLDSVLARNPGYLIRKTNWTSCNHNLCIGKLSRYWSELSSYLFVPSPLSYIFAGNISKQLLFKRLLQRSASRHLAYWTIIATFRINDAQHNVMLNGTFLIVMLSVWRILW
jgi:hypothetical protein